MYSNKISENRESKDDKVENHDISLSHTFLWERKEKIFLFLWREERISISLKRRTSFLFLWIEKNLYISFVETIHVDNML